MTSHDDEFPTLTDVLSPPELSESANPPSSNTVKPIPSAMPIINALEQAETLARIEQNVRETVLRGLQQRLDLMLQVRLEETIQELLNQAMLALTEDLKHNLKLTLNDVVHRAVAQEISRLQAQRVKPS